MGPIRAPFFDISKLSVYLGTILTSEGDVEKRSLMKCAVKKTELHVASADEVNMVSGGLEKSRDFASFSRSQCN